MPIRKGGAKLWFNTQEEIDEYDDRMMASIQLTSLDQDDENYAPVFTRAKKEKFLTLNPKVIQQMQQISSSCDNTSKIIDQYIGGKRDHTYDRNWTFHKFGLGWTLGYLILREIPIRNFYARCWIMVVYLSKVSTTNQSFFPRSNLVAVHDEWTLKELRNYDIFNFNCMKVIPNNQNKIDEGLAWKFSQPGFLRSTPERFVTGAIDTLSPPKEKIVAWDGSWNMPLDGLCHPLHKDAKNLMFNV